MLKNKTNWKKMPRSNIPIMSKSKVPTYLPKLIDLSKLDLLEEQAILLLIPYMQIRLLRREDSYRFIYKSSTWCQYNWKILPWILQMTVLFISSQTGYLSTLIHFFYKPYVPNILLYLITFLWDVHNSFKFGKSSIILMIVF